MNYALRFPPPSVVKGETTSYGGNQMWSENKTMHACGCGVIAGLDLLLYLCRFHSGSQQEKLNTLARLDPIPFDRYDRFSRELSRHYLPLIPKHGINGLSLAAGLNLFFLRNHMPFYTRWGVLPSHFWSSIAEMLAADIPVILAIGPNFPLFWQHNKLTFYAKKTDGSYARAAQTCAHYVTVTGMDEQWLRISSWGKEFYINRNEYTAYIKAHSARLFSNILWVQKKAH